MRADVHNIGVRDVEGGRQHASLPLIHEHLRQHDFEREHARARPATTVIVVGSLPPYIIRHAKERPVRASCFRAGQMQSSFQLATNKRTNQNDINERRHQDEMW